MPAGYALALEQLKTRIRSAQLKAAVAVNRELIELYWDIGKQIVERQQTESWGRSVVDRIARDLQREFLGVAGFSSRNLWKMRAFFLAYTEEVRNLSQPVREFDSQTLPEPMRNLPWGHNTERDTTKPMGVAGYLLRRDALPDPLRDSLPSVELIEAELGQVRPEGESGEAARGRP